MSKKANASYWYVVYSYENNRGQTLKTTRSVTVTSLEPEDALNFMPGYFAREVPKQIMDYKPKTIIIENWIQMTKAQCDDYEMKEEPPHETL